MNNQAQVKHTPGPWIYFGTGESYTDLFLGTVNFVSPDERDVIARVYNAIDDEVQIANANLIAAAPDMLQALKRIHKYQTNSEYRFICDDQAKAFTEDCTFMELMMEHAEVAIAKAEGRA